MGKYKKVYVNPTTGKNRIELDPVTSISEQPLPTYTYGSASRETFPQTFPWVRKEGVGTVASGGSVPTFGGSEGESKEIDFFKVKKNFDRFMKNWGLDKMEENKKIEKAWIWYGHPAPTPPPLPKGMKNAEVRQGKQGAWYYRAKPYGMKYREKERYKQSFFQSPEGNEAAGFRSLSGVRIPRTWSHCLINSNPKAKIQVIGLDKYKRFQTIVDPRYIRLGVLKHGEILERLSKRKNNRGMTDADKIIKRLRYDSLHGTTSQRNAATIFLMEAQLGFRIGSYEKTLGTIKSFGTSTLLGRHIKRISKNVDKNGKLHHWVYFEFPGKYGKMHIEKADSQAFYERVKSFKRRGGGPNDRIFKDPVGRGVLGRRAAYQPVTWKSVHRYMDSLVRADSANRIKDLATPLRDGVESKITHKKVNQRYTSHDFRRWFATEIARREIFNWKRRNGNRNPQTQREYKMLRNEVGTRVGAKLRNSPNVALNHYIHENVWHRVRVPGTQELVAQGGMAKKSVDDNGVDYWKDLTEMFENTHYAGIDDYEKEAEEKEKTENGEEVNSDKVETVPTSETDSKGIEEIKESIGKMFQKTLEYREFKEVGEDIAKAVIDDNRELWGQIKETKMREQKINDVMNSLDSTNLPSSDWWYKIDGVGTIIGNADEIRGVVGSNITPSGVQINLE